MIVYDDGIETEFKKVFCGTCKGIGLKERGKNDSHVTFVILTEDDEQWFVSKEPSSTAWIIDLQDQIDEAIMWLEQNAETDGMHGWKFK